MRAGMACTHANIASEIWKREHNESPESDVTELIVVLPSLTQTQTGRGAENTTKQSVGTRKGGPAERGTPMLGGKRFRIDFCYIANAEVNCQGRTGTRKSPHSLAQISGECVFNRWGLISTSRGAG